MYPEHYKIKPVLDTAQIAIDSKKTVEDIFNLTMDRNKNKISTVYVDEKGKFKSYKYAQSKRYVLSFANYLNKELKECEEHKPIILKMKNGPHWGELFFAILMTNHKILLVDAKTSAEGVNNLAKQAKAVGIVTDDSHSYEFKKVNALDVLEKATFDPSFVPNWEDEMIFCSSGTTGDVKMIVFNGANLAYSIGLTLHIDEHTKSIMYPKSMGKLRLLVMVPFHHVFGFMAVYIWFSWYGTTLIFPASITPTDLLSTCQKQKVTHMLSVPLFWDSLALSAKRKFDLLDEKKRTLLTKMMDYNLGKISKQEAGLAAKKIVAKKIQKKLLGDKIRFCISGGGYISTETLEFINGLGYELHNGFGMTEVGITSVNLEMDVKDRIKGDIGQAFYGCEYKIDPETKELLIKSKTIHCRQIVGGVDTPTPIDENGYFHSGDIAEMDENGYTYIKGRIKDVIINSDGENIFPDELEMFFKDLPHVTHLSVLGVKAEKGKNEDVVLVLETDNTISEDDIKAIEKQVKDIEVKLPHGVKIARLYLAKGKIPIANNMKVKRFVIKKAIEENNGDFILVGAKKEVKVFKGFDQQTIESILVPVRKIFSEVLILPEFKIADDGHWVNDLGGDSMSYAEMIQKVQEKFAITFKEETLGQMVCANDIVLEIANLLKEKK